MATVNWVKPLYRFRLPTPVKALATIELTIDRLKAGVRGAAYLGPSRSNIILVWIVRTLLMHRTFRILSQTKHQARPIICMAFFVRTVDGKPPNNGRSNDLVALENLSWTGTDTEAC